MSSSSQSRQQHFSSISTISCATMALLLCLSLWPGQQQQNIAAAIPVKQMRAPAAYPPISDAWLRGLLGYSEYDEMPRSHGGGAMMAFMQQQQPTMMLMDAEESQHRPNSNGDGQPEQTMLVSAKKRNNAELVNHILKNFASLNRLGDAGKK